MKRKSIKLIATTLLLSTMLSFSSLAAWEQSEQGWKYKDDTTNVYVVSQWIESASEAGLWYYIKDDGIMATNTLIDGVYYVNELGEWRESTGGSSFVSPGNQTNTTNQSTSDNNSRGGLGAPGQLGDKPLPIDGELADNIANATYY